MIELAVAFQVVRIATTDFENAVVGLLGLIYVSVRQGNDTQELRSDLTDLQASHLLTTVRGEAALTRVAVQEYPDAETTTNLAEYDRTKAPKMPSAGREAVLWKLLKMVRSVLLFALFFWPLVKIALKPWLQL